MERFFRFASFPADSARDSTFPVSLPAIAFTITWNCFRSWLPKTLTIPIPAMATSATMMMY